MIRVNVLYADRDGARFDFEYYLKRHIPMVRDRMTPFGLTTITIDKGIGGLAPETPATYICVGSLAFDSVENLQKGLAAHGGEIIGDIPNYTNIEPVIQVSEIAV
jgi:uncharacterized protein (TIGR02118 family)